VNASTTRAVLADLQAAYPYMTVTAEVVEVWAEHLEPFADDIGRAAAWSWVETAPKPPAIAEFLGACRDELRARRADLAEANERGGETRMAAPFVAAIRAMLAAKAAGEDPAAAFTQAAPKAFADEPIWRHFDCRDTGWVEVDDTGHGTVEPCERCNPDTYARWIGGHYVPDHSCADCTRRRRSA
jgi:hypothetical protein